MYKTYILICETRWPKIRKLSIDLARKNISSTVLIKGLIDRQEKEMITKHKGINNLFIPARIFTAYLFIYIFITLIIFPRRIISVFLGKEKTYNRLLSFKKLFPRIELAKVYDIK